MNKGYFIAKKNTDGSPGRPIGDQATGAVMVFDNLEEARTVRDICADEGAGLLSIFQLKIEIVGEVTV